MDGGFGHQFNGHMSHNHQMVSNRSYKQISKVVEARFQKICGADENVAYKWCDKPKTTQQHSCCDNQIILYHTWIVVRNMTEREHREWCDIRTINGRMNVFVDATATYIYLIMMHWLHYNGHWFEFWAIFAENNLPIYILVVTAVSERLLWVCLIHAWNEA